MTDLKELPARLQDALALSWLLPAELPGPQVVQADDGDFEFEWSVNQHVVALIWMNDGHVSWSAICDGRTSSGRSAVKAFIPEECLSFIRKVVARLPEPQRESP